MKGCVANVEVYHPTMTFFHMDFIFLVILSMAELWQFCHFFRGNFHPTLYDRGANYIPSDCELDSLKKTAVLTLAPDIQANTKVNGVLVRYALRVGESYHFSFSVTGCMGYLSTCQTANMCIPGNSANVPL